MKDITYTRATDIAGAILGVTGGRAKFLGGGTNLVDLMREGIETPDAVIDVTGLGLDAIEVTPDGSLWIGATARNTDVAAHPLVRAELPVLAQAVLAGASGQIRNMATVAGNLLQRTRCAYFYDGTSRCNKRTPGAGCDALEGLNRNHAVLGTSQSCIATHPSDMAVSLAALDATVHLQGPGGTRSVPLVELYRLPGDTPQVETQVDPDELITAIEVPRLAVARTSRYRKVRDRSSYAFALVSVAAALTVQNGTVVDVRLALGGVAATPWRAHRAEAVLRGAPATREQFAAAADAELEPARGHGHNNFKIEIARRVISSTLQELTEESSTA